MSLGAQTGFFSYDVWDPADGLSGPHLTLENRTLTDIFCSSMVILPANGNVLIAGGDNWDGTSTTNIGNNNSNLFNAGQQHPDPRQQHEAGSMVFQRDGPDEW